MRRAITLSALGLGSTSPNPPVGCVILDSAGRPVGSGFHRRKGEAHAEANALHAAGAGAAGGTAVVTLEPCNHHGRTPPCQQALIDARIARVLISVIDPTSRGEGGAARLRRAGIDVEVGVLTDEALLVLGPWLRTLSSRRPHVVWAYEAGADGPRALPDELLPRVAIRTGADAIVGGDGGVEEARSGAHAPDVIALPDRVLLDDPTSTLTSLLAGGARSVLLHGGPELAAPFLRRRLVDELAVVHGPAEPASTPAPPGTGFVLPAAFGIASVIRWEAGVFLQAVPVPAP